MTLPEGLLSYRCVACGQDLPVTEYTHFFSSRRRTTLREGRCKACMRAIARLRTRENRQSIRAREAEKKGREYRTDAQRTAERAVREREQAERHALHVARRELCGLLSVLHADRIVAEHGILPDSLDYRLRYRTDGAFRQREIDRVQVAKRIRRRQERGGWLTRADVARMRRRARVCAYCGAALTRKNRTIDHVIPLSRGGEHDPANVAPACRACNCRKARRTPLEWVFGLAVTEGVPSV